MEQEKDNMMALNSFYCDRKTRLFFYAMFFVSTNSAQICRIFTDSGLERRKQPLRHNVLHSRLTALLTCTVVNINTPPTPIIPSAMLNWRGGRGDSSLRLGPNHAARLRRIYRGSTERLLLRSRAAMLLTDGFMYADKEALSCQAGQLPRPPKP